MTQSPERAGADERAEVLARAREYPYEIPPRSFVYRRDGVEDFDPALTRGRTPVLAIGSNQSPRRLAQKFGHDARHRIPVERADLDDFDVVYSAHVASYGAVPAMLQVAPGARVSVAVTWLDDAELELMHASEVSAANYRFAELAGVRLRLARGRTESIAFAYVSSRGHLHDGNRAPLALTAVACRGRHYPAASTAQALEVVRSRTAPDLDPDAFVLRVVADRAFRTAVIDRLATDAGPFEHPHRVLR